MDDLLPLHALALSEFGRRVHAVPPDGWHGPTPDTDWDVSDLVAHLVGEQLWVPPLLDGATVAEVGDRFDGDVLGADPVTSWDAAATGARDAFRARGALDRTVHLSYGDRPARHYLAEMIFDLAVHSWDLARAAGLDERLPDDLVASALRTIGPQAGDLTASGLFAEPVPTPADADPLTRLLGLTGRRR